MSDSQTILITGGAGFIGSHLADELLAQGYRVRALDSLSEQVHDPKAYDPELDKAEASKRIDQLKHETKR